MNSTRCISQLLIKPIFRRLINPLTDNLNIHNCLIDINKQFNDNQFLPNPQKNRNNKHKPRNSTTFPPEIYINNHKLIPIKSTKYLGLHFTDKLNFEKYSDNIKQITTAQLYKFIQLTQMTAAIHEQKDCYSTCIYVIY